MYERFLNHPNSLFRPFERMLREFDDMFGKPGQPSSTRTWPRVFAMVAAPCEDHAYLGCKGVKSHGLRYGRFEITKVDSETGEVRVVGMQALLMPIMNRSRKIWTLQAFSAKPDGRKSLLKNGRKSSNFFIVGSKPLLVEGRPVFILVEGYATSASVHEATGYLVMVCVDAGNLLPVAKAVLVDSPKAMIVFAADMQYFLGYTNARCVAEPFWSSIM